ncbi:Protein of unknown function [Izhakiella capsodis]|uniref:DUF1435 domain-containing protein n=1 Tax=Izhakiella capsodis TaxID=1367852 RepID=A0A1I4WZW2_9GAMM|nr:DUF1435 family protein [Izhakiella capsodis]SFN19271.1 Protein of unknown function [Izhakiella capsodis]
MGETMLAKTLESGWGAVVALLVMPLLASMKLSSETWRLLIALGLLMTVAMLFHSRLRHYILLPSCMALGAGLLAVTLHASSQ